MTKYPYLYSKDLLRGLGEVALKSMLLTESSLKKDSNWVRVYQSQIEDMVARGAMSEAEAVQRSPCFQDSDSWRV